MVIGCNVGLQGAPIRSVHRVLNVAHTENLHNATRPLAFNPLVSTQRRNQLLSVSISRPQRLWSSGRRLRTLMFVASSGAPQEPAQRPAQAEVKSDDGNLEEPQAESPAAAVIQFASSMASAVDADVAAEPERREKKRRNRKGERTVYLLAAIASSIGFTTLAAGAVYYRFLWQMQGGMEVPYTEMMGTFSLAIGAAVGMEFWARWAHKALWHASLWNMHESHHKPREGPFELNDVFAIINAVPAIALMAYGFFHRGFVPGLCFGAGLGITMFGMAYMFVHDGLVHRRFPVGPIADVPYLQKVAAAHQLHHADLFGGVPYGLFLGPKELENVGGEEELQKVLVSRTKVRKGDKQRQ